MINRRPVSMAAASVATITLLLYLPSLRGEFIIGDDTIYLRDNPMIRSIDADFFTWAMSVTPQYYWQPFTWLTYALDYAVWGTNPVGYHLTNIIIHSCNALLVTLLFLRLFSAASRAGGADGTRYGAAPAAGDDRAMAAGAAMSGLLFGIHPMNVEPAAWITGRVDLLSTLFFLLSILAYADYAAGRADRAAAGSRSAFRDRYYLLSLFFFVLALASKPVAVTLPLVLLILDWYPLKRGGDGTARGALLLEKIPFFAMSLAVSALTLAGHADQGSAIPSEPPHVWMRVLVAAGALTTYLRKMVLPTRFIYYYPFPETTAVFSLEYLAAVAAIGGVTAAVAYYARKQPAPAAAWLFYCVTLLPTLGIIKVRDFAMADRYAYLPGVGPFILGGLAATVGWKTLHAIHRRRRKVVVLTASAVLAACTVFSYQTEKQISVWKSGVDLWGHVIDEEPGRVPTAYYNRGLAYKERGLIDPAIEDYSMAIRLNPSYATAYTNRGWAFREKGKLVLALRDFEAAVSLTPFDALAYSNRGSALGEAGKTEMAVRDLDTAISLNPGVPEFYNNRGTALMKMGRREQALQDFQRACRSGLAAACAAISTYGRR